MKNNMIHLKEINIQTNDILHPLVDIYRDCRNMIKENSDNSEVYLSIASKSVQTMLGICNTIVILLNNENDRQNDIPCILGYTLAANSIIATYFLNHSNTLDSLQYKNRYFSQEMFNRSYSVDSLEDAKIKEFAVKAILRVENIDPSYYSPERDLFTRYDLKLLVDYNIKHFKDEYNNADNNNNYEMKETMLLALNISRLMKMILLNGEGRVNARPSTLFFLSKKHDENRELLKHCLLLSANVLYWLLCHYKIRKMIADKIIDKSISVVENIINKIASQIEFPS